MNVMTEQEIERTTEVLRRIRTVREEGQKITEGISEITTILNTVIERCKDIANTTTPETIRFHQISQLMERYLYHRESGNSLGDAVQALLFDLNEVTQTIPISSPHFPKRRIDHDASTPGYTIIRLKSTNPDRPGRKRP